MPAVKRRYSHEPFQAAIGAHEGDYAGPAGVYADWLEETHHFHPAAGQIRRALNELPEGIDTEQSWDQQPVSVFNRHRLGEDRFGHLWETHGAHPFRGPAGVTHLVRLWVPARKDDSGQQLYAQFDAWHTPEQLRALMQQFPTADHVGEVQIRNGLSHRLWDDVEGPRRLRENPRALRQESRRGPVRRYNQQQIDAGVRAVLDKPHDFNPR